MELKPRLKAVAAFVASGNKMADIGTDHAYLPVYLVQRGIVREAVACDIGQGPCQAALRTVAASGCREKIAVRLGDGLQPLSPGEVETVVIAGMGGATMIEILNAAPRIVQALGTLILQPMNAAAQMRRWLTEHQWQIVDEALVLEDGRLYEIICAKPGTMRIAQALLYEIGPCLWQKRHPLLEQHLANLMRRLENILSAMEENTQATELEKYKDCQDKLQKLKEMAACL